ncbi:MAG: magnesium transporter [Gammaproteobacteria bacterium]|nr:MAG: magnesium transporter [Gammaproteobacteria bacterium]
MANSIPNEHVQDQLTEVSALLESGTFIKVRRMLNGLPAADVAHLLEASPPKLREVLWNLVDADNEGEVLQFLHEDIQADFLSRMDSEKLIAITEGLETDDIADILQNLPDTVIREVLQSMDAQDRQRVEQVLTWDEDSAGGLMNTDAITVRPTSTLDVVLRYLRRHEELPEIVDKLFVVNRDDEFLGVLPIHRLLASDPDMTVREIMQSEVEPIPASMPASEVARLFERHDWVSAPVVSSRGKLLGRITIDDVVDVIREGADHSLMSLHGLDEDEDTFATVMRTTPRRAIWLGINLLTAFLASAVINIFEETIEQVVALAVLMPIVASMGGVAGSQTLTVMIRGMALGQIGRNNANWLLNRELMVGALNGAFWALIVASAASLWFSDIRIGLILAAALVINLLAAAATGTLLPILLKSLRIDPALSGSVILTTITDVVGFMAFLGLATWVYA